MMAAVMLFSCSAQTDVDPAFCDWLEAELRPRWQAGDALEWPRVMRQPIPPHLANWRDDARRCMDLRIAALDPRDVHARPRNALKTSVLLQDDDQRRRIEAWVPARIFVSAFRAPSPLQPGTTACGTR